MSNPSSQRVTELTSAVSSLNDYRFVIVIHAGQIQQLSLRPPPPSPTRGNHQVITPVFGAVRRSVRVRRSTGQASRIL